MDILKIILLSLGSIITLFILSKITGNRSMSQLTMFDYINGITIGSIAAEMATSLEDNFMQPFVAMIVYALAILLISFITSKSIKIRRIISGRSLVLYENGKFYKENFKMAKFDISEFLMQCRGNGYFNIADIQSAVLESNGKISFLPLSSKRAATPSDLDLNPTSEKPVANVVIDGKVIVENLKATGNNETWLDKEAKKQGISNVNDIFLATCDIDNNLSIYIKLKQKMEHSLFD